MIYTVLSSVKPVESPERYYIVHGYDNSDMTNLVPTSTSEILTKEDLIARYQSNKLECSNFSVNQNMELAVPKGLPERLSAESQIIPPQLSFDDVWNFLHRLKESNSLIIISKSEYTFGAFKDSKKTYTVNSNTLTYSTTHANCSLHVLIDGTYYNPETEDLNSSKRWYTYSIIKNNELKTRFITLATTLEGLEMLQKDSKVSITAFPMSKILNLPKLDITESSEDMYYCIVDLHSLPLVESNVLLTSNFHYIHATTQSFNHLTMLNKVCKAFLKEIANRDAGVLNLMESDEFYKEIALDERDVKYNGVKFSLSGQSNIPSVNACIKALKSDKVKTVSDLLDLGKSDREELKSVFYRLNNLQQLALETLFHLCEEYLATKNPVICYQATDNLLKFYSTERELFKARLTYIRSMFMQNLHPSVFTQNKLFSNEFNGTTVFIEFGEF